MPDDTPREDKVRRFQTLEKQQAAHACAVAQSMVGRTVRVLCEAQSADGVLTGKTSSAMTAEFSGGADRIGQFVNVHITSCAGWTIKGDIV